MSRDLDDLQRVASESWLWRAILGASVKVAVAWDSSSVARSARGVRGTVVALPVVGRVRFAALVFFWAGAGHLVFRWFGPRYVAAGLPLAWIALGTGSALLVALGADAMTKAWRESVVAKALRSLAIAKS